MSVCQLCDKILYKTKMSKSTQLHKITLHMLLYTYTNDNISEPVSVNLKVDSIESDHFTPWSNHNQVNSNINIKLLWLYTLGVLYHHQKSSIISSLHFWSWRLYWILSPAIKYSVACFQLLHINSCNCTCYPLTISVFFKISTTLSNIGEY